MCKDISTFIMNIFWGWTTKELHGLIDLVGEFYETIVVEQVISVHKFSP